MTLFNKLERKAFMLLVVLLAVICLVPGGGGAFGGLNMSAEMASLAPLYDENSVLRGFADNQYRFGFGVFFTQGLVLLFFLSNIKRHANLFRFATLALFIGGIARVTNIMEYGVIENAVVAPTVIELVLMPLLVLWHKRIVKNDAEEDIDSSAKSTSYRYN